MKWRILVLLFLCFSQARAASPTELAAYYGKDFPAAVSAGGDTLRNNLFTTISRNHVAVGYKRARELIFGEFYLVKSGQEYGVEDVYCQRVAMASEFQGDKPGPDRIPDHRTINAEHTWPQSQFTGRFPGEFQKSDMHHLFPTDSEMNSKRSSYEFGNVVSGAESLKCSQSRLGSPRSGHSTVFEPPVQHKGNVARALFYFAVRYQMTIDQEEEQALREWNRLDPVDQDEATKNDRIFAAQGNRNPFVDHPEIVDKIANF